MSAYIQLDVPGGGVAVIEVDSIAGFIARVPINVPATADSPINLIVKGGETVRVANESIAEIIARMKVVKDEAKHNGFGLALSRLP